MRKKQYLVPAVKRAFDVIELLSRSNSGMTLSEMHRQLKLPLSSVANLLYTLSDLGYVDRDTNGSRYSVGMKFVTLGRQIVDGIDLAGRCRPLLEELAKKTGATVHLAIRKGHESVYIDRAAGDGLIQITSYVGMRWPAHVSAVGKALLAFLPDDELNEVLATMEFKRLTSQTITTPADLKQHLLEIRRIGYASEIGEGEAGIACVAAPLYGEAGKVIAGVSVSGTVFQLTEQEIPRFGKLAVQSAQRMSQRLGFNTVAEPGRSARS